MEYKKSEIEKVIIHLTGEDCVTNTFLLERSDNVDFIMWKGCYSHTNADRNKNINRKFRDALSMATNDAGNVRFVTRQ